MNRQSITVHGKIEKDRIDARENELFARAHPDNVFVAVIGNLWEDGCEEAVDAMVKHTRTEVECWMPRSARCPCPGSGFLNPISFGASSSTALHWRYVR